MRHFFCYLAQKRATLLMASGCFLVFFLSFWLYNLPLKAVLYPAALCLIISVIGFAVGSHRAAQREQALRLLQGNLLPQVLPRPKTDTEAAYQELLRLLWEEAAHQRTAANERHRDTVQYYTVWAHQIKTPIAAMRLLLEREDSALARGLNVELLRIEQYAQMVLTYLRLNSESTDFVLQEYALDEIVRQVLRDFSGEFIQRHIQLDYTPCSCSVVTDEKWLLFVIEQVLSNALKYTQRGTVSLRADENASLIISDTGIGIAPEDLPRIFERGYTGYNGRAYRRATGLGLHLCKQICKKLGHDITITSTLGKGTTVRLTLGRKN